MEPSLEEMLSDWQERVTRDDKLLKIYTKIIDIHEKLECLEEKFDKILGVKKSDMPVPPHPRKKYNQDLIDRF